MKTPLRLLLLEDDPIDADLVAATLSEAGLECTATRVDTRRDFLAALETGDFDLILADYSIPGFDGMRAPGTSGRRGSRDPGRKCAPGTESRFFMAAALEGHKVLNWAVL